MLENTAESRSGDIQIALAQVLEMMSKGRRPERVSTSSNTDEVEPEGGASCVGGATASVVQPRFMFNATERQRVQTCETRMIPSPKEVVVERRAAEGLPERVPERVIRKISSTSSAGIRCMEHMLDSSNVGLVQ